MTLDEKSLEKKADESGLGDTPVEKFMTIQTVFLSENTTISMAIKILSNNKISGAPVLNSKGELIGIISEYDLMIQASTSLADEKIKFIKTVFTISPKTTLKQALIELLTKKVKRLPVVSPQKRVVGIVSRLDIINALINKKFSNSEEFDLE